MLDPVPQDRRYRAVSDVKKILIIEDDQQERHLIKRALMDAGYETATVSDGPDALRHLQRYCLPHLIMLDLGLPTMHGFDVAERIKHMGDVPIVILTANDDDDMMVRGISQYAEDYIIKPVKPAVLGARVRRILSRINDFSYAAEPIVRVDDHVAIDFASSVLLIDGKPVPLTRIEVNMLSVLIRNAGHIVRYAQLFERVWPGEVVYEETVRVHMSRLRQKFVHDAQTGPYFRNERGLGYTFDFPEQ